MFLTPRLSDDKCKSGMMPRASSFRRSLLELQYVYLCQTNCSAANMHVCHACDLQSVLFTMSTKFPGAQLPPVRAIKESIVTEVIMSYCPDYIISKLSSTACVPVTTLAKGEEDLYHIRDATSCAHTSHWASLSVHIRSCPDCWNLLHNIRCCTMHMDASCLLYSQNLGKNPQHLIAMPLLYDPCILAILAFTDCLQLLVHLVRIVLAFGLGPRLGPVCWLCLVFTNLHFLRLLRQLT